VRPKSPTLSEALKWLRDDAAAGVIPFAVEVIEALSKNLSEWGGAGSSNFSTERRATEPPNPTAREAMIRVATGPGGKLRRTNGSTNNSVADLMAGVATEMHGRRIVSAALAVLTRKSPAAQQAEVEAEFKAANCCIKCGREPRSKKDRKDWRRGVCGNCRRYATRLREKPKVESEIQAARRRHADRGRPEVGTRVDAGQAAG
jgi:hypothetical protein